MMKNPPNYACPLCQKGLTLDSNRLVCQNNHSFDFAKEGYINLLPVQFKHSKQPGDNKAMVQARRKFLDKEHYQPLVDKMIALAKAYSIENPIVLDSGCGEGFYTNQHQVIAEQIYGIDIAKDAIRIAAKKYKACHFSVGSVATYPFDDEFFDWVYSVYAPLKESEFNRVLKPGGYLLTVTPAEKHLFELKTLIYDDAKLHKTEKAPIEALTLVKQEKLSYQLNLTDKDDRLNLLAMTPFAFKTSEQLLQSLNEHTDFICHTDFLIRIYQKAL